VEGQEGDAGDENHNGREEGDDEPGGTFCGLRRGLGDPHSVDEGVRDEQEEVHILSIPARFHGNREIRLPGRVGGAESARATVHLL
jgi:hypothetical protein